MEVGTTVNEATGDTGITAEEPSPQGGVEGARPRCVMIVNPYSSSMTSKRERAIVTLLREQLDVDVRRTERGGHAPRIAQEVVAAGNHDVIIACGGDGTANEVLNGMDLADGTAEQRPSFAILPAGGTNVVARSLGYPNHPLKGAQQLMHAIVQRSTRTVNLATVDERIFMFSSGVGLDAEVVKRIEARRRGRRPSDAAHLATILGIYVTSRFALRDRMTVTVEDTNEELRAALLFVSNTAPSTYMGRIPIRFLPESSFEDGLDFMAPRHASALFAARNALQSMGVGQKNRRLVSEESARVRHDVRAFTVTCDEPQPLQADGEYLGDRTHIRYGLLERAVRMVC